LSAVELTASGDADQVEARLREALDAHSLQLFARIDHATGARQADVELDANALLIFGNPSVGTPLMQADPRVGATAEGQLLAIFDLFDEWFRSDDFEGCSFVNVLLEFGDLNHPVGRASADYLENIRSVVGNLALRAGLRDPDAFALSWHILMKGSIVQAAEGDRDAAKRAQALGGLLIEHHR
jgi:hypothetical protein